MGLRIHFTYNRLVVGGQGVVWVSEQDKVVARPLILVTVKEGGAGTRVAKECHMQWGEGGPP